MIDRVKKSLHRATNRKHSQWRYSKKKFTVLPNAKDEPKRKKQEQQQQHCSLFARLLQFVRFAPSQGAER
jgi:hypothetical protein